MTPTQRSLAYLRGLGHVPQVVERWVPQARKRIDLWHIGDIISLSPDNEVVLVQTTSGSNAAARVKKLTESEHIGRIRECGIRVVVHGWRKNAAGRWTLRTVDLS